MAKTKQKLSRAIRRAAVIHALEVCQGDPYAAAAHTKESVAYVKRWQARYLDSNSTSDKPRSGRPRALSKQQIDTAAAWAQLPQSTLRNLMLSMPRRLRRVVRQQGGYIGY
jgi:transposase